MEVLMARGSVRIRIPKKMENQVNASVMNVNAIVEGEIVSVKEEETMIETVIAIVTESAMIVVVGGKEVGVGVCLALLIVGTSHLVGIGIEIETGGGIVTEIETTIDERAGVGGVYVVTVAA